MIRSPFKHFVPLSSAGQPEKPILPNELNNVFSAQQDLASGIAGDSGIYDTAKVDRSKSQSSTDIASALSSLSTSLDAESALKSSLVSISRPSSVVKDQIDYVFSNVAPHPGYGSSVARAELTVIKQRAISVPVVCAINGANSITLPVSASITTFTAPRQSTLGCSGKVASAFYQIIQYRWRLNDAPDQPWSRANQSNFEFVGRQSYELAVRVRISKNATLVGNDWKLQYSTANPSLNMWEDVGDPILAIESAGWNPLTGDPDTLPPAKFVTSPGPGRPVEVNGFYASFDEQSVRLYLASPYVIETEVRYQLYPDNDLTGFPLYFRLVILDSSLNDHVYISSFHPSLSLPWINEVG